MNNHMFSNIEKKQLLEANFGIEREGLRVTTEGLLSMKPHPKVFGCKEGNPYITTDFSESQLELITPVFHSTSDAIDFLDSLYNIAVLELEDEYIWSQSMPAITPNEKDIPIAVFECSENNERHQYREYLIDKYGGKKQLISGIHINFSLGDRLIKILHQKENSSSSFFDFKNELYLKMSRNFLRYNWLLVYLLGATNTLHQTYEEKCVEELDEINKDTYSNSGAISFRNSSCGYQNKETIMPNYETVEKYVSSIDSLVSNGVLKDIRELYSPIRLKGKGSYSTQNIKDKGIEYLEIRSIDCNPFIKSGLDKDDLNFIHLFLLYCLSKKESNYKNWQKESIENSELVAKKGLNINVELINDGTALSLHEWGNQILNELLLLNNEVGLSFTNIIEEKMNVVNHPEKTYSYQISKMCKEEGYITTHMKLAKKYKEDAYKDRFRLRPFTDLELSTQILMRESIKRGITFEILDRNENFIALKKGENIQYVKQATKTSKDEYVSILIMENKSVTKKILSKNNITVPGGEECQNMNEAIASIPDWVDKPVVIKPKSTNFGLGISIFSEGTDSESLKSAFEIAFREDSTVLIESFVKGREYRFLTIGEESVAVLHRVPANVLGDGKSTIAELIAAKNKDVLRGKGYITPLEKIEIDENMKLFLQQDGITTDTIIQKGEIQYLRENSNISTGGDSIDLTDEIPDYYKQIAVEAARAVGANICGVDMIIEDINSDEYKYSIIELNFNPAIHIHSFPYKGVERNIAVKILELLELQ